MTIVNKRFIFVFLCKRWPCDCPILNVVENAPNIKPFNKIWHVAFMNETNGRIFSVLQIQHGWYECAHSTTRWLLQIYHKSHIGQTFKNVKVLKSNLKSNKIRARHKFKLSFSFIFLTCCAMFKISTFTNINFFGAIWTSKSCSSNFFSLALQSTIEILNDWKTCFVVFSFKFSWNYTLNILFHSTYFSLIQ